MAEIEQVLDFIASGGDTRNIEDPFRVRLDCFTVLSAAHDRRALDVPDDAHAALPGLAAQLPDDSTRGRFLDDQPINRALMDAWRAAREPSVRAA